MKVKNIYVIVLPLMLPALAYANLANNPSMEGAFIYQDPLGFVAEGWTAWTEEYWYRLCFFAEGTCAHDGLKSQWIGLWGAQEGYYSFGDDGIYQQINSLQPGQGYQASVWFKYFFEADSWYCVSEVTCSVGIDPNGGTDPNVVTDWVSVTDSTHEPRYEGPWLNVRTFFSPNGSIATIFAKIHGYGDAEEEGPSGPIPAPWGADCYIDDVAVHHIGDLDLDGFVNLVDFAIFGLAWSTEPGDAGWNPDCDISDPNDDIIDTLDLDVFTDNWLAGL